MLRNEKYMGDVLLQKTYTSDFLSKKKVKNLGELPQYYVENNHEPIIPRETFQQAQGNFSGVSISVLRVVCAKHIAASTPFPDA